MRMTVARLSEKIGEGKITDYRILAYRCWYLRRPLCWFSTHTHTIACSGGARHSLHCLPALSSRMGASLRRTTACYQA